MTFTRRLFYLQTVYVLLTFTTIKLNLFFPSLLNQVFPRLRRFCYQLSTFYIDHPSYLLKVKYLRSVVVAFIFQVIQVKFLF